MAPAPRKILVVTYDFPPLATIGSQRPLRLLSYLDGRRWRLEVLTAKVSAYRPGSPIDDSLADGWPASARVVRTTAVRGFTTIGRWIAPAKKRVTAVLRGHHGGAISPLKGSPGQDAGKPRPTLKRTLEELCAMPDKEVGWFLPAVVGGLGAFRKSRPDVIYSTAPAWTAHLVAMTLARVWGTPWVADFRDPWVRSPWNRYTQPLACAAGATLERWVVGRADAVLFTTETARREFAQHYGTAIASKLHVVPNGCDPGDVAGGNDRDERDAGLFVLLHAGTLYGGRSPVALMRAIGRLAAQDPAIKARLRLRFLGAAEAVEGDAGRVRDELGLQAVVEFLPRVGRRESLTRIRHADALLILQPGLTLAIPGKLYEYFAAGRPVLALCEPGELADTIIRHRAGVVASATNEEEIAAALTSLMNGFERSWTPPPPALYDGRMRAAETAAILEAAVLQSARPPDAPTVGVGAVSHVATNTDGRNHV